MTKGKEEVRLDCMIKSGCKENSDTEIGSLRLLGSLTLGVVKRGDLKDVESGHHKTERRSHK